MEIMPIDYLHNHKEFPQLLNIISEETNIIPQLIEKDYWIMHVLHGLTKLGFEFELKGGTSLSKGYKIIDRFSEDIDIHILPSIELNVESNPNKSKPNHVKSRKDYYDWLSQHISIDGIVAVERDTTFDDTHAYRSGGIRLFYKSVFGQIAGIKDGILLEVGFDTVTPNRAITISSWAYDRAQAAKEIEIIDNRAVNIRCYHPGYTLVEKLQTIATKFRHEIESGIEKPNLLRQYYDVYCLLGNAEVRSFIGSADYHNHKKARFPRIDFEIPISENDAFLILGSELRERYTKRYQNTAALYYKGQPSFAEVLARIKENIHQL